MGIPMAYGDSRAYFRTQSDADVIRRMQQQAALSQSPLNSPFADLGRYYNAYANVQNVTPPKDLTTSNKVIADQGFGGAESRPRSRRYRK